MLITAKLTAQLFRKYCSGTLLTFR